MELLDRYLAAIRFWLPKSQREDILAELTEDIRSQIEERESSLGRKLAEPELVDLLQKRGSPYRVACRYLPQRYLIGPAFFPIYALILKGIALFYLVPWFLVWLFMVTFLPSYRASHPGWELAGTLDQLWHLALYAFAFTTLGVVFLERSAEGTGLIDRWDRKWNPRSMPERRDLLRVPRGESIGQFFGGLVFAAYWLGAFRLPTIPQVQIGFTPILAQTLYWPIVVLALAGSVAAAWNLVKPQWTRGRLLAWLTICGLEVVQSVVILSAGALVVLHIDGVTPEKMAILYKWANVSVRITILVIGVFAVVDAVRALRLLMKLRSAAPAGTAPAAVRRAV